MPETKSTCPYCGVGCGVIIESDGAAITGVRGDPDHPANFGRLCSKGSTLHLTASPMVNATARLLHPMRRPTRGAAPERVSWDTALDEVAARLHTVMAQHGPESIGVYGSGQLLTEDYYVLNKFVKGLLGTNNLDTNSRLCMSSAVAGYKATLGADAPPACYDDIAHTQCLFITGSNAAWAHPVLFRRIEDARRVNPTLKIIVVDPRRTDTCEIADLHLQIQPGTDVLLCHGLLHLMLWEGWVDHDHIALAFAASFGIGDGEDTADHDRAQHDVARINPVTAPSAAPASAPPAPAPAAVPAAAPLRGIGRGIEGRRREICRSPAHPRHRRGRSGGCENGGASQRGGQQPRAQCQSHDALSSCSRGRSPTNARMDAKTNRAELALG